MPISAIDPLVAAIFGALLGGAIGSFLGCAYYRVPRKISLSARRSFCPQCQAPIPWYDNIPVFSWLLLRRRGKCCQQVLSSSYLLFELGGALSGALLGYLLGVLPVFLAALLVIAVGGLWELRHNYR